MQKSSSSGILISIKITFLTSYPQFAADAFRLHVSGYLLKPVDPEELRQEVSYALDGPTEEKPESSVQIRSISLPEM